MDVLEDLVLIDETAEVVVDDDLETEVGLLPYQQTHLLAGPQSTRLVGIIEPTVDLRRGGNAVTLLVDIQVDDVALANLHLLFLLMEGTEHVLH